MSTTTRHGAIVFQCDADKCRENLDSGTSNFEGARNYLRRAGWLPYRAPEAQGGGWRHNCAQCKAQQPRTPSPSGRGHS